MMNETISMFENLEEYETNDGNELSCFFTGHRSISTSLRPYIVRELKNQIAYLYSKGVRNFHAGGALGFDTIAATTIIDMKRYTPDMKLILNLPYRNQDEKWNENDKRIYEFIKDNADTIEYAFDGDVGNYKESRKYLLMRNRIMADCSLYCITYYSGSKGGTGYTVKYAEEKGIEIINIYYKQGEN